MDTPICIKPHGNNRDNFIGWTGLAPIAVLFEYVFGIQADVPHNRLIWRIDLTDDFGVKQYPFGVNGLVDLRCKARKSIQDKPKITVSSNTDLTLDIIWAGGSYTIAVKGN